MEDPHLSKLFTSSINELLQLQVSRANDLSILLKTYVKNCLPYLKKESSLPTNTIISGLLDTADKLRYSEELRSDSQL